MATTESPYDKVPYFGQVVPNASPQHLALCSAWHGGPLPPVEDYRALEIGCGDGANLIALAFYQPESTFLGFDASAGAIERAREAVDSIGLTNIRFEVRDVRDAAEKAEPFDYILAHGIFSWIPADARVALLAQVREQLAPEGLAFVSYNSLPGWAIRGLVRDVLLRARPVREAPLEEKASRAVQVAANLLEDLPPQGSTFGEIFAAELGRVRDGQAFYLVHEYLEEVNDPFWFRDFEEMAAGAGLTHVADAQFCRTDGLIPDVVSEALRRRDLDASEREETIDLLCYRMMRMSIVSRSGAPGCGKSRRDLIQGASIATPLAAQSANVSLVGAVPENFDGLGGISVAIDHALAKAAVLHLATRWPAGSRLFDVAEEGRSLLDAQGLLGSSATDERLESELRAMFEFGQVELRLRDPAYAVNLPERPAAHALARFEAARSKALTSPQHKSWAFDEKAMELVASLDGSRTVEELVKGGDEEWCRTTLETVARHGLLEPEPPIL